MHSNKTSSEEDKGQKETVFASPLVRLCLGILIYLLLVAVDPMSLKTESSAVQREAYLRMTRTFAPTEAILNWDDTPILSRRFSELKQQFPVLQGEPWKEPHWSPIHLFLYDEDISALERSREDFRIVTSLPLDDLTTVFEYMNDRGVAVIFLDLRLINDTSYDGNFCSDPSGMSVVEQWAQYVQSPQTFERDSEELFQTKIPSEIRELQKKLRRPILFVAGNAGRVTPKTTSVLWRDRWTGTDGNAVVPDPKHTVLPCLDSVAEVVQTHWAHDPLTYPVTVDLNYDPAYPVGGDAFGIPYVPAFSPAVRILQEWCKHKHSIIRDMSACIWAVSKAPTVFSNPADEYARQRFIPDWVHLTPSIYTVEEQKNRNCDLNPRVHQAYDWEIGRVLEQFRDMSEQAFLNVAQPVENVQKRIGEVRCIMPAYWPGFLDPYFSPAQTNDRFEHSLFGAAAILGGSYENGGDRHYSPTLGSVPGAAIHAVALQSLMWRGDEFVQTPGPLHRYLPSQFTTSTVVDIAALLIGLLMFRLIRERRTSRTCIRYFVSRFPENDVDDSFVATVHFLGICGLLACAASALFVFAGLFVLDALSTVAMLLAILVLDPRLGESRRLRLFHAIIWMTVIKKYLGALVLLASGWAARLGSFGLWRFIQASQFVLIFVFAVAVSIQNLFQLDPVGTWPGAIADWVERWAELALMSALIALVAACSVVVVVDLFSPLFRKGDRGSAAGR